jgi:biopolymer transport protein ExbD
MDAGAPRGRVKSEINVTPLIDVVLVLLIVFIVPIPGLTLALPVAVPRVVRTTALPPYPRIPPLVVNMDAAGALLPQRGRIVLAALGSLTDSTEIGKLLLAESNLDLVQAGCPSPAGGRRNEIITT